MLVERAALLAKLPPKDQKGSRPRCVLMTEGERVEVARTLEMLAGGSLGITATGAWAPNGFAASREVELTRCSEELLPRPQQKALESWWLSQPGGRTPNWDLVARGEHGLLLVEAKAHAAELTSKKRRRSTSPANQACIERALGEATAGLNAVLPGWDLVHAPYQLANRVAWAWKVASMGTPVVLAYLGFRHASEMSRRRYRTFLSQAEWATLVREHSQTFVPAEAWGRKLEIGSAWLRLDTPSLYVPLPQPCPKCGGQLIPIIYGAPSDEASVAAGRDPAFQLGGCVVSRGNPTHGCNECGDTFGRLDESPDYAGHWEDEPEASR